jgi:hypothetical protein
LKEQLNAWEANRTLTAEEQAAWQDIGQVTVEADPDLDEALHVTFPPGIKEGLANQLLIEIQDGDGSQFTSDPIKINDDDVLDEYDMDNESDEPSFTQFIWEMQGNPTEPARQYVALFDFEAWIITVGSTDRVKVPEVWLSKSNSCNNDINPFFSVYECASGDDVKDVWVDPMSMQSIKAAASNAYWRHRTPDGSERMPAPKRNFWRNAFSLTAKTFAPRAINEVQFLGSQVTALQHLQSAGPAAILANPTRFHDECDRVGLLTYIPEMEVFADDEKLKQLAKVLDAAVDYDCQQIVFDCVEHIEDQLVKCRGANDALKTAEYEKNRRAVWTWMKKAVGSFAIAKREFEGDIKLNNKHENAVFVERMARLRTLHKACSMMLANAAATDEDTANTVYERQATIEKDLQHAEIIDLLFACDVLPTSVHAINMEMRSRAAHCAEQRKYGVVMADKLVEALGRPELTVYPPSVPGDGSPPFLETLMELFKRVWADSAGRIVVSNLAYYFFLDLCGKYTLGDDIATRVADVLDIPELTRRNIEGLWHVDHDNFVIGADALAHGGTALYPRQTCDVMRLLYDGGHFNEAHRLVQGLQPCFSDVDDIVLFVRVILSRQQEATVMTAFDFVRRSRDKGNSEELLRAFFEACAERKRMGTAIQLPLDATESECLEEYLRELAAGTAQAVAAFKAHVLFLVGRSRYVEAIQLPRPAATTAEEQDNLDDLVALLDNGYAKLLPKFQRTHLRQANVPASQTPLRATQREVKTPAGNQRPTGMIRPQVLDSYPQLFAAPPVTPSRSRPILDEDVAYIPAAQVSIMPVSFSPMELDVRFGSPARSPAPASTETPRRPALGFLGGQTPKSCLKKRTPGSAKKAGFRFSSTKEVKEFDKNVIIGTPDTPKSKLMEVDADPEDPNEIFFSTPGGKLKKSYDDLTPQSPMVTGGRGAAMSESPAPRTTLNFAMSPASASSSPATEPRSATSSPANSPAPPPRSAMKTAGGSKKKGSNNLLRFAVQNAASLETDSASPPPAVVKSALRLSSPAASPIAAAPVQTAEERARAIMAEAARRYPAAAVLPDTPQPAAEEQAEEEVGGEVDEDVDMPGNEDVYEDESEIVDEEEEEEGTGPQLVKMTPVKGSPAAPFVAAATPAASPKVLNFSNIAAPSPLQEESPLRQTRSHAPVVHSTGPSRRVSSRIKSNSAQASPVTYSPTFKGKTYPPSPPRSPRSPRSARTTPTQASPLPAPSPATYSPLGVDSPAVEASPPRRRKMPVRKEKKVVVTKATRSKAAAAGPVPHGLAVRRSTRTAKKKT